MSEASTSPTESSDNPEAFKRRLSRARHDLRSPLCHILGFTEILLEDAEDHARNDLLPQLRAIELATNEALERINEALNVEGLTIRASDLPGLKVGLEESARTILRHSDALQQGRPIEEAKTFLDDLQRIHRAANETLEATIVTLPTLETLAQRPQLSAQEDFNTVVYTRSNHPDTEFETIHEARIMVVDDREENRTLLDRRLRRLGYSVFLAEGGEQAIQITRETSIDLILLDIYMPGMDGIQTLKRLKRERATQHIPVIMLSSADEAENVVRCIRLGADDFLPKPFNATLLAARLQSSLARKRLIDQEHALMEQLKREQDRSERLLLNILPRPIASRLKAGENIIADHYENVSVLFADLVDFTQFSIRVKARDLVADLNKIFSAFDDLCDGHRVEKIKTIGDAYMVVSGLPDQRADHAQALAWLAMDMQMALAEFRKKQQSKLAMRIGINTGPVVAGVIGSKKFGYDLWGETVNIASRIQQQAPENGILITQTVKDHLSGAFSLKPAPPVTIRGKGKLETFVLASMVG